MKFVLIISQHIFTSAKYSMVYYHIFSEAMQHGMCRKSIQINAGRFIIHVSAVVVIFTKASICKLSLLMGFDKLTSVKLFLQTGCVAPSVSAVCQSGFPRLSFHHLPA